MSAGIKRPRESAQDDLPYGSDSDRSVSRRWREDERRSERRESHLKPGRGSRDDNGSRNYRERDRDRDSKRNYPSSGHRPRSPARPRDRDSYSNRRKEDRRDDRGSYSRSDSYRDKPHGRDSHSSYRKDTNDDHRRRRSPLSQSVSNPSRGVSETDNGDREEGEISPPLSQLALNSPAVPATPRHEEAGYDQSKRSPFGAPSVSTTAPPASSTPAEPEPEPSMEEDEEMTAEEIIAARRARRQAILAKYAADTGPASAEPPSQGTPPTGARPVEAVRDRPTDDEPAKAEDPGTATPEETAEDFSLAKTSGGGVEEQGSDAQAQNEQISAADYDPNQDRREEEVRRFGMKRDTNSNNAMDLDTVEEVEEEVEEVEDDLDDMFALDDAPKKKTVRKVKRTTAMPVRAATNIDAAADPEGYYQIILGELLDNGRYQVYSTLGKGMFSAVVRARIVAGEKDEIGKEVAIKIIRSQESMYKAGLKEVGIINKLRAADPEDKKHVVRLEKTFEHRGHLCLVFESLSMNLREIIKRFGKDVGLSMGAVRAYAQQIFLSLTLLKRCNIMHADIKPDNILVSENRAQLKLCDLGSASDVTENDIAPYLVSRFYRAPEIILGLPYDTALDMWSVGCTLYELYTGKILFPGRTNNNMLLLMMELKGRFNTKMIKRAKFGDVHFDDKGAFLSVEPDKITGDVITRPIFIQKAARDLRTRLVPPALAKANTDEAKILLAFVDLLDKCLALDPAKRLTPKDALMHPFIRGVF